MSEDIKNEDVVPASVVAGEPIIAPEVAEIAAEVIAEIVAEAKTEEAPKPAEDVITGPKGAPKTEVEILAPVADGVIGTAKAPKPTKPSAPKAAPKATKDNEVALYSTRNMHWDGVGKLSKGFNIVSKDAAEKWLTKESVREADPKEIARAYGL